LRIDPSPHHAEQRCPAVDGGQDTCETGNACDAGGVDPN
jgi:hypothetical protein